MLPKEFASAPCVYAVGNEYQIMVPVTTETLMWVRVGEDCFYDDSNGILRSASTTHRMKVPMALLDKAREYTVCYRVVNERKPYFSDVGDERTYTSAFRPVKTDGEIRIYQIADAHNEIDLPVAAGEYFGDELDLLILNGDIPNHSGKIEYFRTIHEIAARLTKGEIPVVFSRGNHDTRGVFAEKFEEHVPTDSGRSYYTFRLGRIWGVVLDCGEDKPDGHAEYGHTVCCADFRRRQTAFLQKIIDDAAHEYAAEGVENRIVISHVPFTYTPAPPFDIEKETFSEWARLLREHVKPQIMLCGHVHRCYVTPVGGEQDHKGQPCPVVVGSEPILGEAYTGCALTLLPDRCTVRFTDHTKTVKNETEILF